MPCTSFEDDNDGFKLECGSRASALRTGISSLFLALSKLGRRQFLVRKSLQTPLRMHFQVPCVRYLGLLLAILTHGTFDASLTFMASPPSVHNRCHSAFPGLPPVYTEAVGGSI